MVLGAAKRYSAHTCPSCLNYAQSHIVRVRPKYETFDLYMHKWGQTELTRVSSDTIYDPAAGLKRIVDLVDLDGPGCNGRDAARQG